MSNGNIIVKILGDDSHFKRTVSGLGKAASVAVRGFAVAGTVLSAAWTAVGLTSVKYNAEIEQLQTSFAVMTGSAEKAASVMERLRKLGAKTPFATKDLAQATQLLMQYGMDADVAIDRMEMLGDISQGNAEKMMGIATAYGQMTSAGKVHLQDIKQMINQGFNPLLEISEKTGESMESLYDRISKGTLTVQEITDAMRSATSEGGRFFGSMEQQSKTVQGLLSTLKDELQALGGDIFKPVSESLRTQLLPEAIRLVQEMQDAYGKRGMDGLIDSVTNEMPRLLKAASSTLEKVSAKLKDKLPGILKKLISALPDLLASAGDSILPTLVDTIFDIVAVAVEEIVGRLPELVPILLRGFWNLIKSVTTGVWDVVTGLFNGLETAMKKMGMLSLTPLEAFEQAWENTDTSQYKDIDVSVGVDITLEEYQTKIDTALEEVRTALAGIPGLTEDQRNAIETAIINGTGIDLINQTLTDIGVPQGKADEITGAITDAVNQIDTVLQGLGLTDEAIENVEAIGAKGGDVEAELIKYGVDPEVAKSTAESINGAMKGIETAVTGLGLTDTQIDALYQSAWDDKSAIIAALLMMGVDPSVIDPVVASYDTLTGSLTASAKSIFQQIYEEFTNGIPESDEDVQKAKDAVTGLFTQAYRAVEQWRQDAIKDLELSGLTGETLDAAIADVSTEAQGMIDELNRLEEEAMAWTEENANKSTAFVRSNLDQLDSIVAQLSDINARIDVLTNDQFNAARSRRQLVIAGAVTNVEHQVEAFALTQAELAQRIEEAEIAAGEAFEKAAEEFAGDAEGYAAREKEILDKLASEKDAAYAMYNAETASIIVGIAKSSPDLYAAMTEYGINQEIVDMIDVMREELVNAATSTEIDANDFWENVKTKGVDVALVAEKLGMDEESLKEIISKAANYDNFEEAADFTDRALEYKKTVENDLATALAGQEVDVDSFLGPVKEAIERGYLQAANEMEWTNFELALDTALDSAMSNATGQITAEQGNIETAISTTVSGAAGAVDATDDGESIGSDMGSGVAEGIKNKKTAVILQARALVLAAKREMEKIAEIASPSKVTKRIGAFFGEGFALGIESQIGSANRAAQRMADSAIGTIDAIGNNMNIAQQVNAGGMASAFQSMLAGMNLATDNGQPVQLFINGRLVAETMTKDTRAAQSAFNTQMALGVGKR